MADPRYPHTYAADLIRTAAECDRDGCRMSRSEAASAISIVADALDMDRDDLCRKLADYYSSNETEITKNVLARFLASQDDAA